MQGQPKEELKSPPGYDFNKPEKFITNEELLEISGITFNQGNPDTVYGVQDEDGRIYYSKFGSKVVKYTHFAKQGDYEDLAILNNRVIVLKSNGTLYSFPLSQITHEEPKDVAETKDLLPKGEYEGLYADEKLSTLYVLCKSCGGKKSEGIDGGYIIDVNPDGSFKQAGNFALNITNLETDSKQKKKKEAFRPSALAKNPVNGQWYVLSSNNNLLVVADEKWRTLNTYELNKKTFLQPEGIIFDKAGNLYISNEGDELANGNILKFVLGKTVAKTGN
jgi:DNA-binding beta-propeller fold protein YncE